MFYLLLLIGNKKILKQKSPNLLLSVPSVKIRSFNMQLPFNFILLFLLFTCANSQAQSDSLNQQKYWDYRDRLTGKDGHGGFLDVGEGPGMSLAASERNPFADCEWDWYLRNSGCKTRKGKGRLHWGDASLYHGFYLAVLALEYVNLERAGQKVDEVSSELWFALKTVERLDSMAEVLLGYPGKLDGFFVRDDVYADFHYKKNSPMKRRFVKDKVPFDCLTSSAACGKMNVSEGGFISQDQVIGLFIGFSAIQQLIPDKRHKDSLPSFGDIAALNAHRITSYMLCNKWKLKGPDGTKIPDEWGGNTIGMSYPVARIANQICNQRHRKSYMCKGAKTWGLPIYDLLHFSLAFQHQTNVGLALMSLALLPERRYRALGRKSIKHDVIIKT